MSTVRCSNCGLLNFVSAENCKRCHAVLISQAESQSESHSEWQPEWQPRPIPEEFQVRGEYHGWFTRWMLFLMGLFGFELLLIGLSHANLLGEKIEVAMAMIFLFGGIPLLFCCHIWLLSRIYQESPGYAVAAFFLPIVSLIAVCKFPEKTKRAFVGRLICLAVVLCSMGLLPNGFANYSANSRVTHVDEKRQVRFEYPQSWSVGESEQFGTLLVSSPDYGSEWKAVVAINAFKDEEWSAAPQQALTEYLEKLRTTKQNFAFVSSRALTHPSNLEGAEFVYTCADKKTGLPVTKRVYLLWTRDGRVFEVNSTAATKEWQQFEGNLNEILNSVRPTY